jgi:hypothetical protein
MIDVVASASHVKGRGPEWLAPRKHSFDVGNRPTLTFWIGEVGTIVSQNGMDLVRNRFDAAGSRLQPAVWPSRAAR